MKILILSLVLLLQQKDDSASVWRNVGSYQRAASRDDGPLSDAQVETVRKTLKADQTVAQCKDFESADSVLGKLQFQRLALSSNGKTVTVLVEAGTGCLRGGQGSNGSMWIVRLNRKGTTVLASPAGGFEGFPYSIQATTNKGYHDIVVGWHLSAFETGLAFFRFNGIQYRKLSQATLKRDNDDKETIVPAR